MKKLKGPELKMPELKVPAFLADLYYDLRDRRLLPLVALVAVAIAAVPFLLGGKEPPLPPAATGAAETLESSGSSSSRLTVVEATPGLRDYRKRLRSRAPADPFEQRFTQPTEGSASGSSAGGAPASESSASNAFSEESITTESSKTTVEVESGGGSSNGGGGSKGSGGSGAGGGQSQSPRLIEFVFDLQISHAAASTDGAQEMSEPEVRRHVRSLTQLPNQKTPVVTVAGLNLHNGKVFFLVSDTVKSLNGDFTCLARTPSGLCELLEIDQGFPLDLVYGPDEVLYRVKVTKVDAVRAGSVGDQRSSRAAFVAPSGTALLAP
jgi:hypothetical protein